MLQRVFGAFDEDDITTFSAEHLSDDDQEEEVSNVCIGKEVDQEDENHSATKNVEMLNEHSNTLLTADVIHIIADEISDTDALSTTSESTEWSEITSSESSINVDKNAQTQSSVATLDFYTLQASLDEQISSPVVQAHSIHRQSENSTPNLVKTNEFPFLMGASTVCEYIDREYREVVSYNSPHTELK